MSDRGFLTNFMMLSVVSGVTIGLGKIVTTLYALSLGASPFQIGVISAMEAAGMMLVTVPAGFVIARFGMRGVYFLSSLGPLVINLLMPLSGSWLALAGGRWLIGLCIPFRIVSMNSAFLERLPSLGAGKAGWYRGTQQAGMAIIGPAAAAVLTQRLGVSASFWIVAALFGLMALFSLSFMPGRAVVGDAPAASGFADELKRLVGDPAVAESCLIELLSSATTSVFSTFIILLAIALPPLTEQDGIRVLLFQGGTTVAMLLLGGTLAARIAPRATYVAGGFLAALSFVIFGMAAGFAALAAGAVLLSAGTALVHLANVRVIAALPGGKSKVAGLYNLATMTGSTAGALAAAVLSVVVSLHGVFLIWLAVLAVGVSAAMALRHRRSIILAETVEAR